MLTQQQIEDQAARIYHESESLHVSLNGDLVDVHDADDGRHIATVTPAVIDYLKNNYDAHIEWD